MMAGLSRITKCDRLVRRRFEDLRARLGSWRAVAAHFDVTPGYVSNILGGRQLPSNAMCLALGITRQVVKTTTYREVAK